MNVEGSKERTNDVNKQLGEQHLLFWLLFSLSWPVYLVKSNPRRVTDVSYFTSNWQDWKIRGEIMRSDMPKLCWRWKTRWLHRCYEMCSAVFQDWMSLIFTASTSNPIYLTANSPGVCFIGRLTLTWPKTKQSYSIFFTSRFKTQRGNETSQFPSSYSKMCHS